MKKLSGIIILILLGFLSVVITACSDRTPPAPAPEIKKFNVVYTAAAGGFIKGEDNQTIKEGGDAESVEAVALEGYRFIRWYDNESTEPQRTDTNITSDINARAIFERLFFNANYEADTGGYIDDNEEQIVAYGENAKKIEAIPYADYLFAGWSDGTFTNPRQDNKVQNNITVTASFIEKTKTFNYIYNNATSNNTTASITLSYDELNKANFVIPQKEHYNFDGWYLETELTTKVTDGKGKLFYGYGVFFAESDNLYAKWVAEDYASEAIIYPILIVYVDEIHAMLETANGTSVDVNYKMPLIERKIYELLPQQFLKYLNGIFEGRVIFEIDTYFTTEPLDESNISAGYSMTSNGWFKDHKIAAYNIPEVGTLLDNYRTVMTTYNMNDNQNSLLHSYGGSATMKYAYMSADMMFWALENNNVPFEIWLDTSSSQWESIIESYAHEFTHTAEVCYSCFGEFYPYHDIANGLEATTQYLRGEYIVNNEKVGIPFSYWQGDLDIIVHFFGDSYKGNVFSENEGIINAIMQTIPFGTNADEVTAIPNDGYRFVKWSDGVLTATRQDKNIISYLRVTAIFEKIE